jgi:hypothetical protein
MAVALACLLAGPANADVAFIVHPDNPEADVSSEELVRMLRQERQRWKEGGKIYLVFQASGSPVREVVLRRVFRMDDVELKRFWLRKLYSGEIASFPHVVHSDAAVKRIAGLAPRALGFVDASAVDRTVKVLRVDGKLPGQPGYFLSSSASAQQ